ncbi:MAG: hypothetical protein HYV07_16720 [Deltaproteobacteria bacterium]|nr:hypothetical protein [Deltaproteobacteria bacterium]
MSRPRKIACSSKLLTAFASLSTFACGGSAEHTPEQLIGESASALWTAANCPAGSNVIQGTQADDVLNGTAGDDCLLGFAGNDKLFGGAGRDTLVGGPGNDVLRGEGDADKLYGQAGDDLLVGGGGKDELDGGKGSDQLFGGDGNDILSGGEGSDELHGDAGDDYASGGDGDDLVEGDAGADRLLGGNGQDRLAGGDGRDSLKSGADNDVVDGGPGEDLIEGGEGDDFLRGGLGANRVDGGDGWDDCGETTTMIACESAACPDGDLGTAVGHAVASGDTQGALDTMYTVCIGPQGAGDVRLTWTAPASGNYVFDTLGSELDTTLQLIYGASCDFWPPTYACSDDVSASEVRSSAVAAVHAGETMTLVVSGYARSAGKFVLNITPPAADVCPNGDLASAIGDAVVAGTTAGQGNTLEPSCAPGSVGGDLTYSWTAPAAGRYAFDTVGSTLDTTLVLSAACGGPELACNDFSFFPQFGSRIVRDFAAGESLLVTVGGSYGQEGDFVLNINPVAPSICPDTDLGSAVGADVVAFDPSTFTADDRASSCASGAPDYEYKWTAPSTARYAFVVGRPGRPVKGRPLVSVFEGECGGPELGCGFAVEVDATEGQVYTIAVERGFRFAAGEFSLSISELALGLCPVADLRSAVGPAVAVGTTEGAGNAFDDQFCSGSMANPDRAFLWTAPYSGTFLIDTEGSSTFAGLFILYGACEGRSGITCGSPIWLSATGGETYTFVVDTYGSAPGPFQLNITETITAVCPTGDLGSVVGEAVAAGALGAGSSFDTWCVLPQTPDATYTWVAPHEGVFQVDTFGSPEGLVLSVFDGTCGGPQLTGCEHDVPSRFWASAGQAFTFAVEGATGAGFVLNVREVPEPVCPTNDLGDATGIGVATGTTIGAAESFPTCIGSAPQATILWTAPSDGEFVFDTSGSSVPFIVDLNTEACVSSLVACAYRSLRLAVEGGQTYMIVLYGAYAGFQGEYQLDILPVEAPACPTADLGSAIGPAVASGSTLVAGSAFEPSCGPSFAAGDVSYLWTPPSSGRYRLTTQGPLNSVLSVREATCDGVELGCNDDFGNTPSSRLELDLAAGTSYVITVDTSSWTGDEFTLGIELAPAPVCPLADLGSAVGESVATGSLVGNGNAVNVSCNVAGAADAVFLWAAPHSGNFALSAPRSPTPVALGILEGGCGGTELRCGGDLAFSAVQGQTFGIVVEGWSGAEGDFDLDIRALPVGVCPTQDLGSSVGPGVATGSTIGGGSAMEPSCQPAPLTPDVTFTWTAPASGRFRFSSGGGELSGLTPFVAIWDGVCSGTELDCGWLRSEISAEEGQVYTIGIEAEWGGEDQYTLQIEQLPTAPCPGPDLGSVLGRDLVRGTTVGWASLFEPVCGTPIGAGDQTYSWTAPHDGTFVFDTAGSGFDTTLTVLDGVCEGAVLACNNDFQDWTSRVVVPLAGGQRVLVVVDGNGSEGELSLSITEPPPGICQGYDLGSALGEGIAIGNTTGHASAFDPTCWLPELKITPDISFVWTAPSTGRFQVSTFGSELGTAVVYVLDGECSGAEVSCGLDFVELDAEAGRAYTIVVEGAWGNSGKFALSILPG